MLQVGRFWDLKSYHTCIVSVEMRSKKLRPGFVGGGMLIDLFVLLVYI